MTSPTQPDLSLTPEPGIMDSEHTSSGDALGTVRFSKKTGWSGSAGHDSGPQEGATHANGEGDAYDEEYEEDTDVLDPGMRFTWQRRYQWKLAGRNSRILLTWDNQTWVLRINGKFIAHVKGKGPKHDPIGGDGKLPDEARRWANSWLEAAYRTQLDDKR